MKFYLLKNNYMIKMEALDFIKIYHKPYLDISKIDNKIYDNENHNYQYYYNLYCNKLFDINYNNNKCNITFKKREIDNIKYLLPKIDDNITKLKIDNYYYSRLLIINYSNNLEEIDGSILSNIIFNVKLPKLKILSCKSFIFNDYQPIEKIIIPFNYNSINNLIKNFNDLNVKLPNLKNIVIGDEYFECFLLIKENDKWFIKVKQKIRLISYKYYENQGYPIKFFNYLYYDINILFNKNYKELKKIGHILYPNNNIIYKNIDCLKIKSYLNIKIINNFNNIKFKKNKCYYIMNFINDTNKKPLYTFYLDCLNINNNKITIKENYKQIIKDKINKLFLCEDINKLIIISKLCKLYKLCKINKDIFYKDIFYYYSEDKKYLNDIKEKIINNLTYSNETIKTKYLLLNNELNYSKKMRYSKYLLQTIINLKSLLLEYNFSEDDKYYYLNKKDNNDKIKIF